MKMLSKKCASLSAVLVTVTLRRSLPRKRTALQTRSLTRIIKQPSGLNRWTLICQTTSSFKCFQAPIKTPKILILVSTVWKYHPNHTPTKLKCKKLSSKQSRQTFWLKRTLNPKSVAGCLKRPQKCSCSVCLGNRRRCVAGSHHFLKWDRLRRRQRLSCKSTKSRRPKPTLLLDTNLCIKVLTVDSHSWFRIWPSAYLTGPDPSLGLYRLSTKAKTGVSHAKPQRPQRHETQRSSPFTKWW